MMLKGKRSLPKLLIDFAIWSMAGFGAYFLRFDAAAINYIEDITSYVVFTAAIKFALIWFMSYNKQSWSSVGIRDLKDLVIGILPYGVVGMLLMNYLSLPVFVPSSIPMLDAILAIVGMGGTRVLARLQHENIAQKRIKVPGKETRVLIAGAGESGTMIAREMLRHPEENMIPVAFIDDEESKHGTRIAGVKVLGGVEEMKAAIAQTDATELLIAMPSAPGDQIRRVVDEARKNQIEHRIIPALHGLISGMVNISQIREVKVEDLLRRDPVKLDTAPIKSYIEGKVAMITGAGGSIGSEIVRQICRFRPSKLIIVGRGENSIYQLQRELHKHHQHIPYQAYITDVRDCISLRNIFEKEQPQNIFHAAAHKHVPLMEDNPEQAVLNNIIGTSNLANLALAYGVQRFVNVSTDKAVNPTSVMGASKRVAEYVVEDAAERAQSGQIFVSVRFGNVLGSRGSVVPLFKDQIKAGGPITITHKDMTRYFMTIPEASQLVLQAGGMDNNGAVYVLDMGEPVKIVDLARDLITLSGLEPDVDVKIEFSGTRPGEKLYEEILTAEEGTSSSRYEKIFMARKTKVSIDNLGEMLETLRDAAEESDHQKIRSCFQEIVPNFTGCKEVKS